MNPDGRNTTQPGCCRTRASDSCADGLRLPARIGTPSGGGAMIDIVHGGTADEPAAGPDLVLVDLLHAMSNPQRLAMLGVLADGEWHPVDDRFPGLLDGVLSNI